ncbi:MAG: hypothetical protein HY912_07475 [Desulfomonile tiedjei]|uniref:Uncharacterized protein n=1 Tax=Desulfomonile tiedjei TaxID=2358 RepID=A0A9D6V0K8_9BACT|nr:hypothetical protein [Desulfomonile tiedjei]
MLLRCEDSGLEIKKANRNARASRWSRLAIHVWALVSILTIAGVLVEPASWAAPPQKLPERKNETAEVNAPPGQIGDSGYVVPIPEIKMRSIIGDRPPAPPPVQEPEVAPVKEQSPPPTKPVEQVQPQETPEPVPQAPAPVEPQAPVETTPHVRESPRLPFDPAARTPQESVRKPVFVEEPTADKDEAPAFKSPQAPEPMTEAPPPKKELLKRKAAAPPIPVLLESQPLKGSAKPISMESLRLGASTDSTESISLDSRKEPEIAPEPPARESLPEPESAPDTRPETATSQPPKETVPVPVPAPSPAPAPTPTPPVTQPEPPPKEAVPMEPPSEPIEEATTPKETVPTLEQPPPPPKESFPSPLDPDVLTSREVRDYLRQAAPILEELSLLMTRAPSLNIADYDPSDPGAPLVPKELFLKMDSMKRELQILDSKTFSIIPPPKYARFHTVIRDSIASTYQACDAILAYFKESSPENLQKVLTSLTRARELIRRTRTAES